MDKIPKPKYEKPVNVAKEEDGKGANKSVYFVCNELGQDWKRLPSVQPIHITSARKIKKFFTGNLDSKVLLSFYNSDDRSSSSSSSSILLMIN